MRILEPRYVHAGQPVATGYAEDGSEGIFVHTAALMESGDSAEFAFMRSEVSREKPVDYPELARLLHEERERGGHVVWVVGPAVLRARSRRPPGCENGYARVPRWQCGRRPRHRAGAARDDARHDRTSVRCPAGTHSHARDQPDRARQLNPQRRRAGAARQRHHAPASGNSVPTSRGSIRDDGPLDTITDVVRARAVARARTEGNHDHDATALHQSPSATCCPRMCRRAGTQLRR